MADPVHHADLHREVTGSCAHGHGGVGERQHLAHSQYERDLEHVFDVDDDDDDAADDSRRVRRRVRGRRHDSYRRKCDVGARAVRPEHPRVAGTRESSGTRGTPFAKPLAVSTKCLNHI